MTRISNEDLREWKRLATEATPAPWCFWLDGDAATLRLHGDSGAKHCRNLIEGGKGVNRIQDAYMMIIIRRTFEALVDEIVDFRAGKAPKATEDIATAQLLSIRPRELMTLPGPWEFVSGAGYGGGIRCPKKWGRIIEGDADFCLKEDARFIAIGRSKYAKVVSEIAVNRLGVAA